MSGSANDAEYPVPSRRHRVQETIRRSRFITTVERSRTIDEARAFIEEIRQEFPDATHNCWAFVAGPPGDTARIGSSDDGEPAGTAGRPMLTVLLHGGIGEIAAVSTRYYGGTKLGTGGLARAYGSGVRMALETLPTELKVDRVTVWIELAYGEAEAARRLLDRHDVRLLEETFTDTVRWTCGVPEARLPSFEKALADVTRGQAVLRTG
jgi:uncharacterized YigZ family protein